MSERLFPEVEPHVVAESEAGTPRMETANRTQVELIPTDLEALVPPRHAVRLVWRFVEGLDLAAFHATIRAREGRAGRPAIDPKILVAIWLYAVIEGVGSAREVARRCETDAAYRWLRGGVSVGYHTLSDVRVAHQAAVDDLLTQSITVLLDRGVVTLTRVTQDGTKVRASAGRRSFRPGERLQECARLARRQLRAAARDADGATSARAAAAQVRAAAEQVARVDEALAQLPAVAAAKRRNGSRGEATVSTTDPDARVMRHLDGGFRPSYNVQVAADVDGQAIVGVGVTTVGADPQELVPMHAQVRRRTGRAPDALVVDAGYLSTAGIEAVAAHGTTFYAPVPKTDTGRGCGPRGPEAAVVAWRARMATPEAAAISAVRKGTAERINADLKQHRGLRTLPVRGLGKVMTWVLWTAVAFNLLRVMDLVPHLAR